jgi:hypothetical protein
VSDVGPLRERTTWPSGFHPGGLSGFPAEHDDITDPTSLTPTTTDEGPRS